MIELTINNLLKITENKSFKDSLKNKNETKLNDRYLYLRRFKKEFIGIFKEDSEYFSDVIKYLLEISDRSQERIDKLINEFIKNFNDMDYKDDKLRLEELKIIDDKSIRDKKEYLFILFKLLKRF